MAADEQEYRAWFRREAEALPANVKRKVLRALEWAEVRAVFFALHKLGEAGELPDSWKVPLGNFYDMFVHRFRRQICGISNEL